MQYITQQMIDDMGITLPADQASSIIEHLNQTLAERIGAEIVASLDDKKVEELTEIQDQGDNARLQTWLQENIPELPDMIQDEVDILLGEIAEQKDNLEKL